MSRKLREALRNVKRFSEGQTNSLVSSDYGAGVSTGSDSDRVALCYWIDPVAIAPGTDLKAESREHPPAQPRCKFCYLIIVRCWSWMWNDTDIPLAYLITFRSYGTWLHGDDRGSI